MSSFLKGHPGLEAILGKLHAEPENPKWRERYLGLVADWPVGVDRALALLALADTFRSLDSLEALGIAYEVYKSTYAQSEAVELLVKTLRDMERHEKADLIEAEWLNRKKAEESISLLPDTSSKLSAAESPKVSNRTLGLSEDLALYYDRSDAKPVRVELSPPDEGSHAESLWYKVAEAIKADEPLDPYLYLAKFVSELEMAAALDEDQLNEKLRQLLFIGLGSQAGQWLIKHQLYADLIEDWHEFGKQLLGESHCLALIPHLRGMLRGQPPPEILSWVYAAAAEIYHRLGFQALPWTESEGAQALGLILEQRPALTWKSLVCAPS